MESQEKKVVVLNALVPPPLEKGEEVLMRIKRIDEQEAKKMLQEATIMNFVRHESTVKILSMMAEKEITISSGVYNARKGDRVLVVRLLMPSRGQEINVTSPSQLEFLLVEYL